MGSAHSKAIARSKVTHELDLRYPECFPLPPFTACSIL